MLSRVSKLLVNTAHFVNNSQIQIEDNLPSNAGRHPPLGCIARARASLAQTAARIGLGWWRGDQLAALSLAALQLLPISALKRIADSDRTWRPCPESETWKSLLTIALPLAQHS